MTNPLALIIEDDQKLANIFAIGLQTAKFETEIVPDGKIALTRLAATTPALVMLDLHLPYISGEEILQQIRADERLLKTKVILATADLLRANSLRGQVEVVLLKPINVNQLRHVATRLRPLDTIDLGRPTSNAIK